MASIHDEIKALFSWNPPPLKPITLPGRKPSTSSCQPAIYDKHISPSLVLRHVKRLPTLVHDLAANVDRALLAASEALPPVDDFFTAKDRAKILKHVEKTITDEKGVANFYDKTAATFCTPLASTLALHPTASTADWTGLLIWTHSVSSSGYAIMDGELRIFRSASDDEVAEREKIVETMESETRRIFEVIGDSHLPFATWEIKSPFAGPLEVMLAVPNLGVFSWTSCTHPNCSTDQTHINKRRKTADIKEDDAVAPLWNLEESLFPTKHLGSSASILSEELSVPAGQASSGTKGKERQEEEEPAENRKRKRKQGDGDEAHKSRHDLTARNLVQQAWAQAVRVDGTIIILHSGNHELVCVRHRKSQTLYVSDLIEPPTCKDPGYGKLQVGIYLAAIQDMMDRTKQRLPKSQPKSPDGGNGGNPSGGAHKSSRFQGGAGGKDPGVDKLVTIEKTIQATSKRDMLLLYLQYGIYDSPIPASFIRSAPPIMAKATIPAPPLSPRAIRTYTPNECLSIVLTSEIGRGATGVVHRGALKLNNGDRSTLLDVAVKLAFDSQQRDMLRTEYETYRRLRSKGVLRGLTTTLGFFDDTEGDLCALVMLYAGNSLLEEPERILSVSDCRSALSTLVSIHHAGILHGDIRRENILVSDSGVTIIDFSHSKQCDDQGAMDIEYARLCSFFGFE
ncbi:hypothetical protein PILCRDRAFT_63060 [Piloderma croceum F 1598]|uniref:Protein kinase domain-containing protein n=1 Tax=Piloderma croceum (strain F 1598) TaxID=765440 RepID=A0A0C3CEB1_PILCF|nr:hypothetical protein PILCRDRAFT_63060 [Piloderma croceum F 1598]